MYLYSLQSSIYTDHNIVVKTDSSQSILKFIDTHLFVSLTDGHFLSFHKTFMGLKVFAAFSVDFLFTAEPLLLFFQLS